MLQNENKEYNKTACSRKYNVQEQKLSCIRDDTNFTLFVKKKSGHLNATKVTHEAISRTSQEK